MTKLGANLTENKKCKTFGIDALTLHILALIFMLCDHLWATVIPGSTWLTCVGRLAYPIFAFKIAEGYRHTRNFKKYALRMLLFALISEIPFNLMYGSSVIYPFHQNVMWTFLIALLCLRWMDNIRRKGKLCLTLLSTVGVALLGYLACTLLMTDYYGYGFLTVLLFHFTYGRKWYSLLAQFAGLYLINGVWIKGQVFPVTLFGQTIDFRLQAFAILAMLPILLYNGKPGRKNKGIQYACYAFYPVHMLLLYLIAQAL